MKIDLTMSNKTMTVKIVGPIKYADSFHFGKKINEVLAAKPDVVNLDLSMVPLSSSAGLGLIVILYKQLESQNIEFKITEIHEQLYTKFTAINLHKLFVIERNI